MHPEKDNFTENFNGGGGAPKFQMSSGDPGHFRTVIFVTEWCLLDMMLMAGSRWEFEAHWGMLAAASGDFHAMFSRALWEVWVEQVWLHGVEPECLVPLLNFGKMGHMAWLALELAERLPPSADLLQSPAVKEACIPFGGSH
ncbi:UNVERIFIED_CONTAM: hypothetical protein K2H54_024853 [Gekko kuhli]